MTKRTFAYLVLALSLLLGSLSARAAESGELMSADVNIHDKASLQHGAKLFFNYCAGCHSLNFMRYSRIAKDLGLTKKEVMNNLNFTDHKFRQQAVAAMRGPDAEAWFGKAPPDLSLEAGEKGADWIYSYLNSFYLDPDSDIGWNNTVLKNASMPNVLWQLQGIQKAELGPMPDNGDPRPVESLNLVQPGSMTPDQFHKATRDIAAFLTYVSEPAALKRHAMAPWVLLFLVVFSALAWLLKHEYWKDVH